MRIRMRVTAFTEGNGTRKGEGSMQTRMAFITIVLLVAVTMLFLVGSIAAGPPSQDPGTAGGISLAGTVASKISYQGRLTDAGGNPLDGSYNLVFQLWDDATAGSQVGSDIVRNSVPVSNGLFTVELDVPQDAFNGQGLWLQVSVSGQTLSPRQELLPVPYALSLKPGAHVEGDSSDTIFSATNTGDGDALRGSTSNPSGHGVYGEATNSGDVRNYGGFFVAEGTRGRGVYGKAANTADEVNYGGFFYASGVQGRGVFGQAEGSEGIGVKGWASDEGDVQNYGGHFLASGRRGSGVYGEATGEMGRGVFGSVTGGLGVGVLGEAWGEYGIGVYGWAMSEGDAENIGGLFRASGDQGTGVRARASGDAAIAVEGLATGANGVGVYAKGGPSGYAGYFEGNVEVQGDLTVEGQVPFPRPAYDSGWVSFYPGEDRVFNHNLGGNVDNYIVDMQFKGDMAVHQYKYGTDASDGKYYGAYWRDLTGQTIRVYRFSDDVAARQIRIRIWVYE
jgi:hypothetical protein